MLSLLIVIWRGVHLALDSFDDQHKLLNQLHLYSQLFVEQSHTFLEDSHEENRVIFGAEFSDNVSNDFPLRNQDA